MIRTPPGDFLSRTFSCYQFTAGVGVVVTNGVRKYFSRLNGRSDGECMGREISRGGVLHLEEEMPMLRPTFVGLLAVIRQKLGICQNGHLSRTAVPTLNLTR